MCAHLGAVTPLMSLLQIEPPYLLLQGLHMSASPSSPFWRHSPQRCPAKGVLRAQP